LYLTAKTAAATPVATPNRYFFIVYHLLRSSLMIIAKKERKSEKQFKEFGYVVKKELYNVWERIEIYGRERI